ncbi:hypothetical protein J6590_053749 [Homalodisca vitripennis]|nr:hypothetical protein J6590_053749 [Homalodisca vitripennis]
MSSDPHRSNSSVELRPHYTEKRKELHRRETFVTAVLSVQHRRSLHRPSSPSPHRPLTLIKRGKTARGSEKAISLEVKAFRHDCSENNGPPPRVALSQTLTRQTQHIPAC